MGITFINNVKSGHENMIFLNHFLNENMTFLKILFSTNKNFSSVFILSKKLTNVEQPCVLILLEQNNPVSHKTLDLPASAQTIYVLKTSKAYLPYGTAPKQKVLSKIHRKSLVSSDN